MIPKELKALIDEHCMGIKDAGKISPEVMDLIMSKTEQKKADFEEVQKYMEEVISGPTKAEREAMAKAEAERAEKERLAAIERAKREKREAAEHAERERLAAIERAEKEKKEAAARAEREKKEAIFKELKKKYPTADISGIGDIQLYQKPIDKWEDEFKASAKRQTIIKIKNIAYWVVFSILLIFTSVWVCQFAESTWDKVLSTILILMGFGVNLYYRLKDKYEDSDVDGFPILSAGLLWQHFFVDGFWMTLLSVIIIIILCIIALNRDYKVRRTMTWIIVALLYLSLLAYPFLVL